MQIFNKIFLCLDARSEKRRHCDAFEDELLSSPHSSLSPPPAPGSFHVFHDFVVWLILLEVLLEDDQTLIYTLYDYLRAKVYWSASISERRFSIWTKDALFKRQRPFYKISKSLTSGYEKPYFGSALSKWFLRYYRLFLMPLVALPSRGGRWVPIVEDTIHFTIWPRDL